MKFNIKSNPEDAHLIDKIFYLDDRIFNIAIEKIFKNNPIYIGHISTFNKTKGLYPKSLYPHFLNEEIILKFDNNNLVKILSNVCTHRAHIILDKACLKSTFQCPYHGRKFNNNGEIKSALGFEDQIEKIKLNENLKVYPKLDFLNFHFLSISDLPINHIIGDYSESFKWYPFEKLKPEKNYIKEFEINVHWAFYVENYLEGLHIPFIHKGLAKEINLNDYKIEILPRATLQIATTKSSKSTFAIFKNCPNKFNNIAAFYFWIYPNTMINIYPWGISVNIIIPISKEKTLIRYETFSLNPDIKKEGAGGNLGVVEKEDQNAILNVQRGIKSNSYSPGKISSVHELGIHHFHKLLSINLNT